MKVLPGDLVSVTAGAILRRGAPVVWVDGIARGIVTGYRPPPADAVDVAWDGGINSAFQPSCLLSLDLDDPAGMDLAARWLARHHGLTVGATAPRWFRSEPYWVLCAGPQEEDGEEWDGELDFGPSPSGGGPDRRLRGDVTDPAEALALACLAAGGRP